jgi:hypothetical protein
MIDIGNREIVRRFGVGKNQISTKEKAPRRTNAPRGSSSS